MNSLQALVTGYIAGSLSSAVSTGLLLDVHAVVDEDGNYMPQITVIGKESGTRLKVKVEVE